MKRVCLHCACEQRVEFLSCVVSAAAPSKLSSTVVSNTWKKETADILKGGSCKWRPDMLHISSRTCGRNLIGRNWPELFLIVTREGQRNSGWDVTLGLPKAFTPVQPERGVTLFNMTAFFHHVNSALKQHSWRRRLAAIVVQAVFFRIFPH